MFSLGLHALLVLWLFQVKIPLGPQNQVELEIQEKTATKLPQLGPADSKNPAMPSRPKSPTVSRRQGQSLGRFLPKAIQPKAPSQAYNHGDSDTHVGDNPSDEWGQGAGEFGRIADYSLMVKVQEHVEGLLNYPGTLASKNVSGTVNARLVLTDQGECRWKETQISSNNQYLRVYILGLLKNLCKNNLKMLVKMRKSSNIDMSFRFDITDTPTITPGERDKVVGNTMFFYRNHQKPSWEWRFGPFRGNIPMALFGLYFVALDFEWLKDNWETYIEGIDPMTPYREKDQHNTW